MKVENGKIVFERIEPTCPPPPPPPHPFHPSVQYSAPPPFEDSRSALIDELRDELRETKERLAVLENEMKEMNRKIKAAFDTQNKELNRTNWRMTRAKYDIDKLYSFRSTVWMPKMSQAYGDLYDFNTEVLHITSVSDTYNVTICDKVFCPHMPLEDRLQLLSTQLRRDRVKNIVIQPNQTAYSNFGIGEMTTPSCVKVIRFILEWLWGEEWYNGDTVLQITITSNTTTGTPPLSVGFVVSLCEQLQPASPIKIVITQARISEQTELKNKVDKDVFKKIEFEKVVSSA
jgi:hypothetical protein